MLETTRTARDTAYESLDVSEVHDPVAELRGVSKLFGEVVAARDLDLRIGPGEFL